MINFIGELNKKIEKEEKRIKDLWDDNDRLIEELMNIEKDLKNKSKK